MAYYFNYQCFRLRGNSSFLNPEGTILPEQINAIGEGDVVLVIALPRYPAKTITIAKYAKAKGAFIIGITDDRKSPLNKYSNYSLLCTCKSIGFHNSTIGVAMLIDYLLIALSFKDEETVKKRLDSMENALSDPSLMIYH
jgi:DNA-binding MurR/RpiR family transcriptional regulator